MYLYKFFDYWSIQGAVHFAPFKLLKLTYKAKEASIIHNINEKCGAGFSRSGILIYFTNTVVDIEHSKCIIKQENEYAT